MAIAYLSDLANHLDEDRRKDNKNAPGSGNFQWRT